MKHKILIFLSIIATASSAFANGETRVTLYPGMAEVHVIRDITLNTGKNTVTFEDIPTHLDLNTVKVTSTYGRSNNITSKTHQTSDAVQQSEAEINQKIRNLEQEHQSLAGKIKALSVGLTFLDAIAKGEQTGEQGIPMETWEKALETVILGTETSHDATLKAREKQQKIERDVERLHRELSRIQTGVKEKRSITATIQSDKKTNAKVMLTYLIPGPTWVSVYDFELNTEKNELSLTQYGVISQRTSHDWKDVKLSLSTATPNRPSTPPDFYPWFLDFGGPQGKFGNSFRSKNTSLVANSMEVVQRRPEPVLGLMQDGLMEQQTTVREEQPFATLYHMKDLVTLAGNGNEQRLLIKQEIIKIEDERVVAIPEMGRYAWLQLEWKAPRLLPAGQTKIFRDGAFVGGGHLPLLAQNTKHIQGFGVDDKVTVEIKKLEQEKGDSGIISKKGESTRLWRYKITNYHNDPIDMRIFARMPVAEHEDIKVTLHKDTPEPNEHDYKDKKGVMLWDKEIKSQKRWQLDFGYRVVWSKDKTLPGF